MAKNKRLAERAQELRVKKRLIAETASKLADKTRELNAEEDLTDATNLNA